jgi:hypothetical protein
MLSKAIEAMQVTMSRQLATRRRRLLDTAHSVHARVIDRLARVFNVEGGLAPVRWALYDSIEPGSECFSSSCEQGFMQWTRRGSRGVIERVPNGVRAGYCVVTMQTSTVVQCVQCGATIQRYPG